MLPPGGRNCQLIYNTNWKTVTGKNVFTLAKSCSKNACNSDSGSSHLGFLGSTTTNTVQQYNNKKNNINICCNVREHETTTIVIQFLAFSF